MKSFSNNTLLALLLAVALQGSLASSTHGRTLRHSRLTWPRSNSSFKIQESSLFGSEEGFEHPQSSNAPSQAAGPAPKKQEEVLERMQALGISLMLLGGVAFQMALFYLVNFPHPGIAFTTWRVLSTSSSIFISSSVYHLICMHYSPHGTHAQVRLTIFLACYFISSLCLQFRSPRTSEVIYQAVAAISGYVASFAAMSLCLELQNYTLFTSINPNTGTRMIVSTVLAALVFIALAVCINQVGNLQGPQLDKKDSEQCEDAQDSVLSLCVSFLIVVFVRFYICGHVQYFEDQVKFENVTPDHAKQLLLCGSAFAIAAALGACAVQRLLRTSLPSDGSCSRLFSIMLQLVSLTSAWMIFFAGEWQLQLLVWESPILGGSLFACSLTVFSFFAIVALNCVAKHTSTRIARQCLKSFESALGLLVGFSWAKSLVLAMEDVAAGAHIDKSNIAPHAPSYHLAALLLAVVFATWRYLILPRAMQPEAAHELQEESLEKSLKAAAGRTAKLDYGTLKEKWPALGFQFSSPRRFNESAVLII